VLEGCGMAASQGICFELVMGPLSAWLEVMKREIVSTGVCANCGRPAYRGEIFCCDACTAECIEDLNRGTRYVLVEDE
jgi:hypothetical protein